MVSSLLLLGPALGFYANDTLTGSGKPHSLRQSAIWSIKAWNADSNPARPLFGLASPSGLSK
jgi:hypothetical protein